VTGASAARPVTKPITQPPEKSGRSPPSLVRAADAAPEKLIGFYIAEHEGTSILGPKIHAALQAQGLRFGAKNIYHRLEGSNAPLFSIASLTKPGHLDPAEAAGFSTPGLSVFMLLPGPPNPTTAFQDMLRTARNLAAALNAQLYDTELREPLTEERARVLQLHVEEWARRRA
jgi:cell division protein ZipA